MGQGYSNSVKPFLPTSFILIGWYLQPFGRWGDVFFLSFALLTLGGATYYSYKTGCDRAKEQEAERIKQFLSHQRHDWMNDVQVLLGYLTLKKYDRMKTYLQEQVQKANQERLITQLRYGPLAMALVTLPQRYLQWSMNIKVEDLFQYTTQEEKNVLYIIEHLFPWLEKQLQDVVMDLRLNIRISKKEQLTLTIHIQEESDRGPVSILMNDLAHIRKTIRKWNGDLTFIQERNEIQIKI